jgi:hypothetical protein
MINALTVVRAIRKSSETAVHLYLHCLYVRLYGKDVPVHTIKAYRGSGDTTPLTLNLTLDGGAWSASHPNLKIQYIHCKLNFQSTLTYDMLVFIHKKFLAQNGATDLLLTRLQTLKICGTNLIAQ